MLESYRFWSKIIRIMTKKWNNRGRRELESNLESRIGCRSELESKAESGVGVPTYTWNRCPFFDLISKPGFELGSGFKKLWIIYETNIMKVQCSTRASRQERCEKGNLLRKNNHLWASSMGRYWEIEFNKSLTNV